MGRFFVGKKNTATHDTCHAQDQDQDKTAPHILTLDDLHHRLGLAFLPHGFAVEAEEAHDGVISFAADRALLPASPHDCGQRPPSRSGSDCSSCSCSFSCCSRTCRPCPVCGGWWMHEKRRGETQQCSRRSKEERKVSQSPPSRRTSKDVYVCNHVRALPHAELA